MIHNYVYKRFSFTATATAILRETHSGRLRPKVTMSQISHLRADKGVIKMIGVQHNGEMVDTITVIRSLVITVQDMKVR